MSSPKELTAFEKANQAVHPVEKQWHFPILTNFGFKSITPSQVGFVRSYTYLNDDGHQIVCVTGSHADYWRDSVTGTGGYHATLLPHLKQLVTKSS